MRAADRGAAGPRIAAVIMASGFSRRMTCNKLLLPFKGKPLAGCVMDVAKASGFFKIVAVTADEAVSALAVQRGIKVLHNDCPQEGQSRCVILGTRACRDADGIMFIPGDMPFLTEAVLKRLMDAFREHPGCVIRPLYPPVSPGPEDAKRPVSGSPVIFPGQLYEALMQLQGDTGGRQVLLRYPQLVRTVAVDDPLAGIDVDTPGDARRWLGISTPLGEHTGE